MAISQCTLSSDDENCVTEKICIENLAREVVCIFDGDDDAKDGEESGGEEILGRSVQKDCLTLVCAQLQRNDNFTEEHTKALFQFQNSLRLEKQDKMTKSTIMDHFVKK